MKRIICILLTVAMCFAMSITATAITNEISFPMTTNTGFVSFNNTTAVNTNLTPSIPANDSIVIKAGSDAYTITKVSLFVEGERYNYCEKVRYDFDNYIDANCTQKAVSKVGQYWKLDLYTNIAYAGGFLVDNFDKIYSITLVTEAYCKTDEEKVYNDFGNATKIYDVGRIFTIIANFTGNAELTNIISDIVSTASDLNFTSKEIYLDYPFLPETDRDKDGIISRAEVDRLSYSKLGEGKGVAGFEGLASQVAAFFNKQNNGKITFKLTTAPSTIVSDWNNGGIPAYSTDVFASNVTNTDNLIGLFFNYETTGSLVSASKIGADGTITFDISNVLNDMGGNTLATLKSVYYGMIGGINYTGFTTKGIKVESVILSYDGEATDEVETVIIVEDENKDGEIEAEIPVEAEDEDDEEEVVVPDEDDEEVEPVEEVVITDDETDDATIIDERTVVEEEPIIEEIVEDIDSENPHTGVALVVMPTLILGIGALALSRKRK